MNFLYILLIYLINHTMSESTGKEATFTLNIFHINDFHARIEPLDISGGPCHNETQCIGGYARLVNTLRYQMLRTRNVLFLNAGNNLQGSLWHTIGGWNAIGDILNLNKAHAMTMGNHDFDIGIENLIKFLGKLKSPILAANIDATNEPRLEGKFQKSIIMKVGDQRIGIIGAICHTDIDLKQTGHLKFRNASEAIWKEAKTLKTNFVNITIALTHCDFEMAKVIARFTSSLIDVVVSARSHTIVESLDTIDEPRARILNFVGNHNVVILEAGAFGKYLGHSEIVFDDVGNVVNFESKAILIDGSLGQDPYILQKMQSWKTKIDIEGQESIGHSSIDLYKDECDSKECMLGNLYCDAMISKLRDLEKDLAICLVLGRSIKAPLRKGEIKYADVVATYPFAYNLTVYNIPGDKLMAALEFSVSSMDLSKDVKNSSTFLQVSGLRVKYDLKLPPHKRIVDMKAACRNCLTSKIYQNIKATAKYRIVTSKFLQHGGEDFTMLRDFATSVKTYGIDTDAVADYIYDYTPIYPSLNGRIKINI
ncbi:5'-nucleotidase-related protein-like isoform X1 [Haematobia irritans]|uniref:5'-nucleotidase-related protein-like isoform X1 n=1 Tax=Haematobia irritans TaxID=7368 RepID=UPI003F4F5EFF